MGSSQYRHSGYCVKCRSARPKVDIFWGVLLQRIPTIYYLDTLRLEVLYNFFLPTMASRRLRSIVVFAFFGVILDARLLEKAISSFRGVVVFFFLFLGLSLATFFYDVLIYPHVSPLRHLPLPPQPPLRKRILKEPNARLFEEWINTVPNEGLIRYFGILNSERILITSSKGIRDVLQTNAYCYEKQYAHRTTLERMLGKGIVTVEGDCHKFHRKQMSRAFTYRRVKQQYGILWSKTVELLDVLTTNTRENTGRQNLPGLTYHRPYVTDISDWVSRTAMDVIGKASYGIDFGAISHPDDNNRLVTDYRKSFKPTTAGKWYYLLALLFPGWLVHALPTMRNKTVSIALAYVRSFTRQVVQEKRKLLMDPCHKGKDLDILKICMEAGGFSDFTLEQQCMTLLAAGHESTASALTSAIWFLSQPKYYHMQVVLREEIRSRLPSPSSNTPWSVDVVEALPYLTAVRQEILRFYSPFSLFGRTSIVATTISGHQVPANTMISLAPWAIHRSKDVWGTDAGTFRPERWLEDPSGGARDAYSYLTFGAGPRRCIGERLAQEEIATVLAGLVGRFNIRLANPKEISPRISHQITVAFKGGVHTELSVIEGW